MQPESWSNPEPFLTAAGAVGDAFLAEVYAAEVARKPGNVAALSELGHVLTRLGRHAEGLAVDEELVRLQPRDPTAHYNLACSLSLLGRVDEAFAALERAIEHGYDDPEHVILDGDLAAVRADPRFEALVRRIPRGQQA